MSTLSSDHRGRRPNPRRYDGGAGTTSSEIPDDAHVPEHLRGGRLRIRLDTTEDDRKRGLNRAEVLRQISPADPDWGSVYAIRPSAESIWEWYKSRLVPNRRAPAVGVPRQWYALLCGALYSNFRPYLMHCRRLGIPLPADRLAEAA